MKRKPVSLEYTTLKWSVAYAGYEIRPSDERFLFPRDDPQRYISARFGHQNETTPLENNATLYRDFADLPPADEAVLTFANKYGLLSSQPSNENAFTEDDQREPLSLWFTAIKSMKKAVEVWQTVSAPDYPALSRLTDTLTANRNPVLSKTSLAVSSVPSHHGLDSNGFEVPTESDLVGLARTVYTYLVNNLINSNLEPLSPRLRSDSFSGEAPVHVTPKTLLSGIWLQLAAEVAEVGVGDYKQCERCGKWMNTKLNRSDKRTCSEVCKKALQRKLKRNSQ